MKKQDNIEFKLCREEIQYVITVLYQRKLDLGLIGVEAEQSDAEYVMNQQIRGYLERTLR